MRLLIVISMLASILSFPIYAANPNLELAVAKDIQGLINETVNAGDQVAYVKYTNNVPHVTCKISNHRINPNLKWAFCSVGFTITFEDRNEFRNCSLLYSFTAPIFNSLKREKEDFFQRCVEALSESVE